jgi:hypothetical protein
MLIDVSNQCDVSGLVAVASVAVGAGLMFLAIALTLDFRGFRTRCAQRDEQVRRWLAERRLKYYDDRFIGPKYFIVGGGAAFIGLVFIVGGVKGLIAC